MKGEVLSIETTKRISELEKENKELKEEIQRQSKALCINDKLLLDYRDRINKAIEYIQNNKLYTFKYDDEEMFEITTDKIAKDNLLKILGGDE